MFVKSYAALKEDIRISRIANILNISQAAVIGHIHLLWWFAVHNAKNGFFEGYSPQEMELAMMWRGAPGELLTLLVSNNKWRGFLYRKDNGYMIDGWAEIYGQGYRPKERQPRQKTTRNELLQSGEVPYSTEFTSFWEIYPKKTAKIRAFETWGRIPAADRSLVLSAAASYRANCLREGVDLKFVKNPATFLSKEDWRDWLSREELSGRPTLDPKKYLKEDGTFDAKGFYRDKYGTGRTTGLSAKS
jgi:hypothetical protein